MLGSGKKTVANRFQAILSESAQLNRKRISGKELDPAFVALSVWQANRLQQTYSDFAKKRRFDLALDFFLNDLYGPVDFSQRDEDIQRIFPLMVKVLSADAIESLAYGLELNTLTLKLDAAMVTVLQNQLGFDPDDPAAQLNSEMYAEAYRRCDNRKDREKQITLVVDAGKRLQEVTRKRLILTAVKVARKPAQLAGFGELQSFIERGLAAFRAMGNDATEFMDAIESREMDILKAIYASKPLPWYSD